MTNLISLREVAHLQLVRPPDNARLVRPSWLPVCHTEFHLACLYFPLAVRFHEARPSLGLIVGEQYLTRAPFDPSGRWQGGYKPIAMRCSPFQCRGTSTDPLADILVPWPSSHLTEKNGVPIVDHNGEPTPLVRETHRLLRLLQESLVIFAKAVDQLFIANLLVPLEVSTGTSLIDDDRNFYVIDGARFMDTNKRALGALTRHDVTALDISVACLSSQRLLREQYRSKLGSQSNPNVIISPSPPPKDFAVDDLNVVLDDGELISLPDIDLLPDYA